MTERLVETLLGLFLIYLGYRVGWKGELWTIHRYHTAYVAEQDRMKFLDQYNDSGTCRYPGKSDIRYYRLRTLTQY